MVCVTAQVDRTRSREHLCHRPPRPARPDHASAPGPWPGSPPRRPSRSRIEFLRGSAWGQWEGALAMANLKTQKLVLLRLSADGRSVRDASVLLEGEFGRLRSLAPEPDGSLLMTTSDADGRDQVIRVSPAR
ncbi:PQQ-dependent sugar dehydrogenase [Dietzia cercidiphylli]|uniref:PQQ-dependent sugar dehydrogenase n=1 Tax=Dietzia cercidiphylli TaxID=498199 RepID=UPI003F81DEB2